MPKFSDTSRRELGTAHRSLQRVFLQVIKITDIKIVKGFRDKKEQDAAYKAKLSKVKWPNGKHNKVPSEAVDVYPFPIPSDLNTKEYATRCVALNEVVQRVADSLGIQIRWGGDWDGDGDMTDQKLHDLVHFEVILS